MNASHIQPFSIKDCALAAIATGIRAQNLKELKDVIGSVSSRSIYYHFWGERLRPQFDDPMFNNDFAAWSSHGLHDSVLAERLSVIDPTDYADMEAVRKELVEVIEQRLDESAWVPWSKADNQFHFIKCRIVVFDTRKTLHNPAELSAAIAGMSVGSVFYHFIDARRRHAIGIDDFRAWLSSYGDVYKSLCEDVADIDPYFQTLTELRSILAALFRKIKR